YAPIVFRLLWMRNDVAKNVAVAFDGEIETPSSGDASLPDALRLVVLLRSQRRMPQVLDEEFRLLIECSLDVRGSVCVVFSKTLRKVKVHSADAKLLLTGFLLGGSGEGL